jgi:hypothetical protein
VVLQFRERVAVTYMGVFRADHQGRVSIDVMILDWFLVFEQSALKREISRHHETRIKKKS